VKQNFPGGKERGKKKGRSKRPIHRSSRACDSLKGQRGRKKEGAAAGYYKRAMRRAQGGKKYRQDFYGKVTGGKKEKREGNLKKKERRMGLLAEKRGGR